MFLDIIKNTDGSWTLEVFACVETSSSEEALPIDVWDEAKLLNILAVDKFRLSFSGGSINMPVSQGGKPFKIPFHEC